MGFELLTIPRGNQLLNQTVAPASTTSYTPSARIVGTGLNYTTELRKLNSLTQASTIRSEDSNQVPTKPFDPECDPESYLQQKNQMFKNLLKYMDEYTTYNFLKVTNPHFSGTFMSSNVIIPLQVNVTTKTEKLFYFRLFPDDKEICDDKLELVRAKLAVKDYSLKLEVCGCNN